MLEFLQGNLANILVGLAVAGVLFLALWAIYRQKKRAVRSEGCSGCCCGCSHGGGCHEK